MGRIRKIGSAHCNYSQILYQFLTFTQNLKRSQISVKVQLKTVMQNRPYLLALAGQILFGFTLYGRNADILYYFTYVEGNATYYTT